MKLNTKDIRKFFVLNSLNHFPVYRSRSNFHPFPQAINRLMVAAADIGSVFFFKTKFFDEFAIFIKPNRMQIDGLQFFFGIEAGKRIFVQVFPSNLDHTFQIFFSINL